MPAPTVSFRRRRALARFKNMEIEQSASINDKSDEEIAKENE